MFTRRMVVLLTAALGLAAVSGCSRMPVGASASAIAHPTFERAHPPGFAATSSVAVTGSQTIDGRVGGSVSVGSFRIDVPAGAFQGFLARQGIAALAMTFLLQKYDPGGPRCDCIKGCGGARVLCVDHVAL